VKNKHLPLLSGLILLGIFVSLFSCRKINEATTLGTGLIPAVDNINTFDTTLEVEVFNDSLTVVTDSTLSLSYFTHYLGQISNDPFFGRTSTQLSLELKPSAFPHVFVNKPDSLHIDSVVLILDYVGTYGDTTVAQTINVYELASSARLDTTYRFREPFLPTSGLLGSRTFLPSVLNDSIKVKDDTTANQLRIRLNNSFGDRLLQYDTTASVVTGAYRSDSAFKSFFKGFALESASGGNAIMGFNLNGDNTKLAIYYRDDNNDALVEDTVVQYFTFAATSGSANIIRRDYSGTPFASTVGGAADNYAFVQATPGSFTTIKVPGLSTLSNRIVHRAELIMEEAFDLSNLLFPAPDLLFLDVYNPAKSGYTAIPYDFLYDINSGVSNISAMGGSPFQSTDGSGNNIKIWRFNVSRYVQHIVNGTEPAYDFRLSAPVYTPSLYKFSPTSSDFSNITVYVNSAFGASGKPGVGRVRLHGGDATRTNPHRMRMRIVYSKI